MLTPCWLLLRVEVDRLPHASFSAMTPELLYTYYTIMSQMNIHLHFHYGYMHTAEFLHNGSFLRGPSHMLAPMKVYDWLNLFNQSINQ